MARKVVRTNLISVVRKKEEELNLKRRLTNKEIAEEISASPHTISKWMSGEVQLVDLDLLARLMVYFNCSLDDLLVVEEMPEASN